MTIYKAGRQLLKVRFIILLSLLCAAVSIWFGVDLVQTYGSRPADGGVLAPLGVRIAWGGGVMLLGIGFAVGMWLYSRNYIARLDYDETTELFTACHVWFPGSTKTTFRSEDILVSRYNRGRMQTDITVDAPWWSIRIAGRSEPMILDAQGMMIEQDQLKKLLMNR